jgi:hypothetical protein
MNKKILIMEKSKNNLIVLIFTFCSLIIMFGCNKYSDEIEKTCPDCEQIKVRKSDDIIFVKKGNGEGNVFSKSQMKFILDKWYPAKYDEGIMWDDISFTIEGHFISFDENHYNEISNENVTNKLETMRNNASYSSSSADTPPAGYHKGGSCSDCNGTGYYQHDLWGTKLDDTGSQCASCGGKGYHWVKD